MLAFTRNQTKRFLHPPNPFHQSTALTLSRECSHQTFLTVFESRQAQPSPPIRGAHQASCLQITVKQIWIYDSPQ